MTIEIIKRVEPKKPEENKITFKCSHCKSKLRASPNDACGQSYDKLSMMDYNVHLAFNCPVCKHKTWVVLP